MTPDQAFQLSRRVQQSFEDRLRSAESAAHRAGFMLALQKLRERIKDHYDQVLDPEEPDMGQWVDEIEKDYT